MPNYQPFTGVITRIEDFGAGAGERSGCNKIMSVVSGDGSPVDFIVTPTTYFVDHVAVALGDTVTGFYDADAPTVFIFPPQLQAIVMAKTFPDRNIKVDYFDSQLVSSDGMLKLDISPFTQIILENDQLFTGDPTERYLIVVYGITTRSIPAQTTPEKIVVMC